MKALREAIFEDLRRIPEGEPVAVTLSSGVDSTSILAALLELKRYVTVYSFTLNGWVSRDFAIARENARRVGLPFIPVFLPSDLQTLKEDVKRLIMPPHYLRKKADIECAWPWLYMLPSIAEQHVATGLCSDAYFGMSRRAKLDFGDKLDEWRQLVYDRKPNYSQLVTIRKMASKLGKEVYAPYRTDAVRHLFDGMNWDDLNLPKEKYPIRKAFEQEFARFHVYPHTSLQLGDSRISEHFERLLQTELNPGGRYRNVVGVYNEIYRQHKSGPKASLGYQEKRAKAAEYAAQGLARIMEPGTSEVEDE